MELQNLSVTHMGKRALEVSNTKVSRDERNEYHGASIKKAADTMGVPLVMKSTLFEDVFYKYKQED